MISMLLNYLEEIEKLAENPMIQAKKIFAKEFKELIKLFGLTNQTTLLNFIN